MLKLTAAAGLAALMVAAVILSDERIAPNSGLIGDAATTVTAAMRHFSLDPAAHGVETRSAGGGLSSLHQVAP
jgi:hypothetical protein